MAVKLLIHAPDSESLRRGLNNLKNARAAEPNGQFELLINGPAAAALDPTFNDSALRVCENSIKAQNLRANPNWHQVPAAVIYAAKRQAEGWAYWRA